MGVNQYYGGKRWYRKKIATVIEQHIGNASVYIEPFCGWCSVLSEVVDRNMFEQYKASDANESVILFLNDVSRGLFVPPTDVTREEYYALKASPSPSALQAFAGVIYSFNGIWFNNYAGSYAGAGLKARGTFPEKTVKRLKPLSCVEFKHAMYHEYADHEGCLFYMDPPYKKRREKYKTFNGVPIPFDTDEFWEFTRKLSKKNTVLVSEYEAPDDFECILEFPGKHGVEKVFKLNVI